MRGIFNYISLLFFFCLFSICIHADMYFADPVKSIVSFNVNKFKVINVKGVFKAYTIYMNYDVESNRVERVEAKVDVNSIDTGNKIRDRKVRYKPFFDMFTFSDILCVIDEPFLLVDSTVPIKFKIKGIDAMIGVVFSVEDVVEDGISFYKVTADFNLNRHDFGIKAYPVIIDDYVDVNLVLYFRSNND